MIINILKNNFYRTLSHKNYIIISLVLTIISISMAVYFTTNFQIKSNIAVVTKRPELFKSTKYVNIVKVKTKPPMSDLVLNKYDAVIIDNATERKENGGYKIETLKSNAYKNMLEALLNNKKLPKESTEDSRGIGTNILGYMLMFLMMQGILYMFTFADDKEKKQITRISASPVSFFKYLIAQYIFTFLFIYVPTIAILEVIKEVFKFNIGFSMLQYAFFVGIISALSASLSIFLYTIVEKSDTANMIGSSLVTLTTILSGGFSSFTRTNKIFNTLINLLPQKDLITFVEGIEKHKSFLSLAPELSYVIAIILILFVIAVLKNKRDYVQRID